MAEQVLKGNVELQNLKFEMALDEIYDKNLKKTIHQGFFFEGLLHIKSKLLSCQLELHLLTRQ